jgi:hypothetical protein
LAGSTTTCGANPCTFNIVIAGTWTDVTPSALPSFSPGPVVKLLDGRLLMIGAFTCRLYRDCSSSHNGRRDRLYTHRLCRCDGRWKRIAGGHSHVR